MEQFEYCVVGFDRPGIINEEQKKIANYEKIDIHCFLFSLK